MRRIRSGGARVHLSVAGAAVVFGAARGGIVAHGPRRSDVIAVGYVAETERADGAYAAVSDELAPKGYSYLLISKDRATVASCLFADFHNKALYRERTVEFFRDRVSLELTNARRFGMRYALVSGHFAARAWLEGKPQRYEHLWRPRLRGLLRTGLTNRYLYERMGNGGYARLLRHVERTGEARDFLRRWYGPGIFRRALYPLMRRRVAGKRDLLHECRNGCHCTLCRGVKHRPTHRAEPLPAPPCG